jgi:hypothetical protein
VFILFAHNLHFIIFLTNIYYYYYTEYILKFEHNIKKSIMKKNFTILLFTLFSFALNSQTITAKPIYKGSQNLIIEEFESGAIGFFYQDSDYQTIVKITSFIVNSKQLTLELIDKAITILAMEKTDKEQNIEDNIAGLRIVRYGFTQKFIYISNKENKSLILGLKELQKIKQALEVYTYQYQKDISK